MAARWSGVVIAPSSVGTLTDAPARNSSRTIVWWRCLTAACNAVRRLASYEFRFAWRSSSSMKSSS